MGEITQNITGITAVSRKNFTDDAADAMMASLELWGGGSGELSVFAAQANGLRDDANGFKNDSETAKTLAEQAVLDAEDQAELATIQATIASSAANFKGNWSDLTGSLNVPASVYHLSKFWQLASDLIDVTAKVPGTDPEWIEVSIDLNGGAETTNTGSTITLTEASKKVQNITTSEIGVKIKLPDATTITKGFVFIIHNIGNYNIYVANNSGDLLHQIETNSILLVFLLENTTSDGNWDFSNILQENTWSIFPGAPEVFESATTSYISVTALDSTHAVVTYTDGGNGSFGTACLLDYSSGTIVADTPEVFESASTTYISVTALDSTHAVVTYTDGGNGSFGTACLLDYSSGTIVAGAPVVFESASTTYISVTALDSTHAIVTYRDGGNSGHGTACLLDYSSGTIVAGAPVEFESASTYDISVTALDSTHAIVTYRDGDNSNYGTACLLDYSSGTIVADTPEVFESASTYYISVTALDSTHAVVTYTDGGNGSFGTACLLDYSSGTIVADTPEVFESATTSYISVTALDSTHAVVTYTDGGNGSFGTACLLDYSSGTIVAGAPVVFESATTSYISVTALDSTHAIVTYRNDGNSGYGTACLLGVII